MTIRMTRTNRLFTQALFVFFGDVYLVLHTRNLIIIVAVLVKSCVSFNLGPSLFFHFIQCYCLVYKCIVYGRQSVHAYFSQKRVYNTKNDYHTWRQVDDRFCNVDIKYAYYLSHLWIIHYGIWLYMLQIL